MLTATLRLRAALQPVADALTALSFHCREAVLVGAPGSEAKGRIPGFRAVCQRGMRRVLAPLQVLVDALQAALRHAQLLQNGAHGVRAISELLVLLLGVAMGHGGVLDAQALH